MEEIDYRILDSLESARLNLRYIIREFEDKSDHEDRLNDVIHSCHAVLDAVEEIREEYEDRAQACDEQEAMYG